MSNTKEVAKLAGVSVATVSRTLRHPDMVAEETRKLVLEAAAKAKYRPNMLARNFRKNRAHAVLILVPDIANPFFSSIIKAMQAVAIERGYSALLCNTDGMPDREDAYARLLLTQEADGIIQFGARVPRFDWHDLGSDTQPPEVSSGRVTQFPFVHVCECPEDASYPGVAIDNKMASATIVDHLISLGRKRIAVITGPASNPLTRDRLSGWRQAMEKAGYPCDDSLVYQGDFSARSGKLAGCEIMKQDRKVDAVFSFNDEMAIGAIQAIKNAGLQIPQDIMIAGFDDIDMAQYCDPPLTTIGQPKKDIGTAAMRKLIDVIEGKPIDQTISLLPVRLVLRESTMLTNGMCTSGTP